MTITAYHFVGAKLRDGRPIPADGEWLVHDGPLTICRSGLHASRRPCHALHYAPGATLCEVECDDIGAEHEDKLVCRRRRIVRRVDATAMLRRFACDQALLVVHLWSPPQVVLDYLRTGDGVLPTAAWRAAPSAQLRTPQVAQAAWGAWVAWAASWRVPEDAARATATDASSERFDAMAIAALGDPAK